VHAARYSSTVEESYSARHVEEPVREGAEYFASPASAAQRRYEALRAYFQGSGVFRSYPVMSGM
jgi:hypothetical protein